MSEALLALTVSFSQRQTPLRGFEVLLYEQLCIKITNDLKEYNSEGLDDDS